jgi:hypothetical protein
MVREMNTQILQQLLVFLERVPVTGLESVTWCTVYAAVKGELEKPSAPPAEAKEK